MKPLNVRNLFPAGTVLSANRVSIAQPVYDVFCFAIQVVITGTPTGTIALQGSCDPAYSGQPNSAGSGLNSSAVNWTDIPTYTATVNAAGSTIFNYADSGFSWVRVTYTDTSSGSSTAIITVSTFNGKGF